LKIDLLFLEATADEWREIAARIQDGQAHVPLLGADSAALVRAGWARNPDLVFKGVEETPAQRAARHTVGGPSKQGCQGQ